MTVYDKPGVYPLTLSKGKYIFEAWGGQGGSCNIENNIPSGGFINYTLSLDYNTEAKIYIGGKGSTTNKGDAQGGTNGGGNGWIVASYCNGCVGGGGGSTYVYLNDSILIFVAAGGGDALKLPCPRNSNSYSFPGLKVGDPNSKYNTQLLKGDQYSVDQSSTVGAVVANSVFMGGGGQISFLSSSSGGSNYCNIQESCISSSSNRKGDGYM